MYRRQRWLFTGELFVEVTGIGASILKGLSDNQNHSYSKRKTHDRREVRWGDTLIQDIVEADVLEEWMSLNLFSIGLAGA